MRTGSLWLAFSCVALAGAEARADDSNPVATELQPVVVTGTNIPRTAIATAAPVQVLSRKDIEASGKHTISEVVQGVAASGQGNLPITWTFGFSPGGSGVSLRGLGVNSTLVLINGRRMAPYGLADDGVRTFVDLNTVPIEAVDRIEVLKDGASAIYGSDAIAGVVNIILRKDYQGGSLGVDYGTSVRNDGTTKRIYGTYGLGNPAADGYNVFVTLDASMQGAIQSTDRSGYLGTANLEPYGFFDNRFGSLPAGFGYFGSPAFPFDAFPPPTGVIVEPGTSGASTHMLNMTSCAETSAVTGECLYDQARDFQIQPKQDRVNLYSRGTVDLIDGVKAYVEAGYFHAKTHARVGGGVIGGFGVAYSAADPFNPVAFQTFDLPADHPDNVAHQEINTANEGEYFGWTTPYLLPSTGLTNENQVMRFVAGVNGELWDGHFDTAIAYMRTQLQETYRGILNYPATQAALTNGTLRVDPALTPADVVQAIAPDLRVTDTSSVALIDAKYTRDVLELPWGGALGMALGAEYRRERMDSPPLPGTENGEDVGIGFSQASQDRSVFAAYAEAAAPLTHYADVEIAGRWDHYSDYGNSVTPKIGLKVRPIDQLALRGSYSTAFRAPGPAESGPQSASFGFIGIGVLNTGNPDLRPETAHITTLGLVAEPIHNTSLSIDYYRILRKSEIEQIDAGAVAGEFDTNGPPNSAQPGSTPGVVGYYGPNGTLQAISAPFVNGDHTRTEGIDFEASEKVSLGPFGKITANLNWTHVLTFKKTFAGQDFEYAGTEGPFVVSSDTGSPKDRATLALTWERGAWSLTGNVNYVGPLKLIDHEGETLIDNGDGTFAPASGEWPYGFTVAEPTAPACGVYGPDGKPFANCRIRPFTTVDLFAKWSGIEHWEISGSVQNVFDVKAPLDPYTYGGLNYNPAWAQSGAVGPFVKLGAKYRF